MHALLLQQIPFESKDLFWLTVVSILGFVIVICVLLLVLRNNEKVLAQLIKQDSLVLRVLTILIVIWATTGLVIIGRFNEGVSALFGAIIGYVFGSIRAAKTSSEA